MVEYVKYGGIYCDCCVAHMTVETALATEATNLGHSVSCTETRLSSDSMVASPGPVTFAWRNGVLLTGRLLADGDKEIEIDEFIRPVKYPSVGKKNTSSEKVKEIAHEVWKRDMLKRLATVTKDRSVNDSGSVEKLMMSERRRPFYLNDFFSLDIDAVMQS